MVKEFKDNVKEEKLGEIIDIRGEMSSLDTLGLSGVSKLIALHDSLDREVGELVQLAGGMSKLDRSTKAIIAQYEGTKSRFEREKQKLSDELSRIELSLKNIKRFIDQGLIVYHKFRANNQMGTKVLNEMVFVLDKSKSKVIAKKKL